MQFLYLGIAYIQSYTYFVLQGVCSQLEHSVVSLVTSPGLEEADTALMTSLLNRSHEILEEVSTLCTSYIQILTQLNTIA